jgi:hypothetical protein
MDCKKSIRNDRGAYRCTPPLDRGRCHSPLLHFNSEIIGKESKITHLDLERGDDFLAGAGDDQIIDIHTNNQPATSPILHVYVVLGAAPLKTK